MHATALRTRRVAGGSPRGDRSAAVCMIEWPVRHNSSLDIARISFPFSGRDPSAAATVFDDRSRSNVSRYDLSGPDPRVLAGPAPGARAGERPDDRRPVHVPGCTTPRGRGKGRGSTTSIVAERDATANSRSRSLEPGLGSLTCMYCPTECCPLSLGGFTHSNKLSHLPGSAETCLKNTQLGRTQGWEILVVRSPLCHVSQCSE